jgi:hypothetical protein
MGERIDRVSLFGQAGHPLVIDSRSSVSARYDVRAFLLEAFLRSLR